MVNKKGKKDYIFAVGRRREAVARVRLYQEVKTGLFVGENEVKRGDIIVNNKKITDYFSSQIFESMYKEPLKSTNSLEKYAITIAVEGGGPKGQLGAVVHGISRALSEIDEKNRGILKKKGLLTRDPRVRQRRKVGMGGKSRREKQSPKR